MIVITGASSGIGLFLYETYKSKGETVRGTCFTKDLLDERPLNFSRNLADRHSCGSRNPVLSMAS